MEKLTDQAVLFPHVSDIIKAQIRLKDAVVRTPLMQNFNLSERYQANILLKREDLQVVRSYKIRGALNKITSLSREELDKGVVCASAGNHAQGVAYACNKLKIKGVIFMPTPTPQQKVRQVRMFGKEYVDVRLIGDTFDDSYAEAVAYCNSNGNVFIHPFDDEKVIEGQGTVALEILEDAKEPIDFLFVPIGGGGLASGVGSYFKHISPKTKIIGIEPEGAPAMKNSLEKGKNTTLEQIDKFVDGAAVKRVGDRNFSICQRVIDDVILIPEGKVCTTILKLYNEEAIVVEPAGALSIAALDFYADQIQGKNVVCVVSGSNNDITRMEEIKERSLIYEGLKLYFIVDFPQRAGALREFLMMLGANDDITYFEYIKKVNREKGPAIVGIEVQKREDGIALTKKMERDGISFRLLNEDPFLFSMFGNLGKIPM